MSDYEIDIVKTGRGLAGSRVALLFAPNHAPPGSLIPLTEFINKQPHLRAVPGYHGPNQNHVLRVSGLKDDAHFMALLKEEFPRWLAQSEHANKDRITIAPNLEPEPINEVDHFPHRNLMERFVKEHANALTGSLEMVGNLGLFFSAWKKTASTGAPHDHLKMFSSVAYVAASSTLIALGYGADHPRDVYTIMEEVYPELKKADAEKRAHVRSVSESTLAFMRNHPWEISAMFNMTGATAHIISALKRHRGGAKGAGYEALAALGTLTAMSITAFVPEKEGRNPVELGGLFRDNESPKTMLGTMETMTQMEPSQGETMSRLQRFSEWMQQNPLKISATIQSIANTGYFVSGLARKPGPDYGLMTMSGSYLSANAVQTQASKGRGPGFDDVVTAAASIIHSDPELQHMPKEEIDRRIAKFAEALGDEKEVVHKKRRIAQGIKERLERYDLPREEENQILTGFDASEKKILKESPFVRPRYVEQIMDEPAPGMAVGV